MRFEVEVGKPRSDELGALGASIEAMAARLERLVRGQKRFLGDVAHEVLAQAGEPADSVHWLIPHQANIRIIQATAKRLGLPMERVITTLDHHGNTSAASIPLALDEAVRTGKLLPGQRIIIEGVGGGFTWGAALIDF